jgi:hypothetical protein
MNSNWVGIQRENMSPNSCVILHEKTIYMQQSRQSMMGFFGELLMSST